MDVASAIAIWWGFVHHESKQAQARWSTYSQADTAMPLSQPMKAAILLAIVVTVVVTVVVQEGDRQRDGYW